HNRIFQAALSYQTQIPERLDFCFGYEGPGGGHLPRELAIGDFDRSALYSDQRVRKIYQTGDRKLVSRADLHSPVAFSHFDLLEHAQELARRFQFGCARMLDHFDEWLGTAIEDWYFQRIKLYDAVVDVAAGQRSEQVLDSRDHNPLPHQSRGVADAGDMLRRSGNLKIIEINPPKDITCICGGGTERQPHGLARM